MSIDRNADNIQVIIRVRPLNQVELSEDSKQCVLVDPQDPNKLVLDTKPESKTFNFDWVGGEKTNQREIFELVGRPLVQTCLEGYNCCIFAYGQTGAGKTYTMQGGGLDSTKDNSNRGLQPRVFDHLFSAASKMTKDDPGRQFSFTCSYLEIYNEQIIDLLEPVGSNLMIREDIKKGVYVDGIKEEVVRNSQDTINLLKKGAQNRHVGTTRMNFESSRSHSVFTVSIESKKTINGVIHIRSSKFHFVDLAGSERQKSTLTTGERLKEAGLINKSLLILGSVINSLVEVAEGKVKHIGYRDSKLTFLLRDSLGGNSRTCLIANISPSGLSFSETLSTLKFAQRAKQIKNKASINEDAAGNVENLKKELKKLKEELQNANKIISMMKSEATPKPKESVKSKSKQIIKPIMNNEDISTLDDETILKENIEILLENQLLAQAELEKRDENLRILKDAIEMYQDAEKNYKSLLEKYQGSKIVDEEEENIDSKTVEQKEKEEWYSLLKNTPLILKTFEENIALKQKIDALDDQFNTTSSISIAKSLKENTEEVKNFLKIVEGRIKEKRFITSADSNINVTELESELKKLKEAHSEEMERVNLEMFELKQKECEHLRKMDIEQKKTSKLLQEIENLKSQKQEKENHYEIRIKDMLANFELAQREKIEASESENQKTNIKIIELNDQLEKFRQLVDDMSKKYQLLEDQYSCLTQEKDSNEKKLLESFDNLTKENMVLNSHNATTQVKLEIAIQETEKLKNQVINLTQQLSELLDEKKDMEVMIENLTKENSMIDELKRIEAEKSNAILDLESNLEEERIRYESIEAEKLKLQEELDTTFQTLAFNNQALEEKKNQLNEANIKIKSLSEKLQEIEGHLSNQQEANTLLKKQISEHQTGQNAVVASLTNENQKLKDEIITLKYAKIKAEESLTELKIKETKLNEEKVKLQEIIDHYSNENAVMIEKLAQKTNELKLQSDLVEFKTRRVEELQKINEDQEKTLTQREKEIKEIKAELYQQEKKNNEYAQEVQNLSQSNGSFKLLISDQSDELSSQSKKIEDLENDLKKNNDEKIQILERFAIEKTEFSKKITDIQEELNLLREVTEKKTEISTTDTQKKINRLVQQIYLKDDQIEKINSTYNTQLEGYQKELTRIREKFEQMEKNHQLMVSMNKNLKEENEKYKLQIDLTDTQNAKVLEDYKKSKEKIGELENEIRKTQKYQESLIKSDDLYSFGDEFYREQLKILKEENANLKDEMSKYKEKIAKYQEKNKIFEELAKSKISEHEFAMYKELMSDSAIQDVEQLKAQNEFLVKNMIKLTNIVERKNKTIIVPNYYETDNIQELMNKTQNFVAELEEKEKKLNDQERDLKLKASHSAIIEREYSIIKKKYNLIQSNFNKNLVETDYKRQDSKENSFINDQVLIDIGGFENHKPSKTEGKISESKKPKNLISEKTKEKVKQNPNNEEVVILLEDVVDSSTKFKDSTLNILNREEGEVLKKKIKGEN